MIFCNIQIYFFFYAIICLSNVPISLQAVEYIRVKTENPEIYNTSFSLQKKECVLQHSFPQVLQSGCSFTSKERGYINNYHHGDYEGGGKIKGFVKALIINEKLVDDILKFVMTSQKDKACCDLLFEKNILRETMIKGTKDYYVGEERTNLTYEGDGFIGTKFSYFLPVQITPFPFFAQFSSFYKTCKYEEFVNKEHVIELYNSQGDQTNISIPQETMVKQFFLDYVGPFASKDFLSLLVVMSTKNYYYYEDKIKRYTISVYDCSEFVKKKVDTPIDYLLTLGLYSTTIMTKDTDTIDLISVKDGVCILYDSATKQTIVVDYKKILTDKSVMQKAQGSNLDDSVYGLGEVYCYVTQNIEKKHSINTVSPTVNEPIQNKSKDEVLPQNDESATKKSGLFFYATCFVGGTFVMGCIAYFIYAFYLKK